MLSVSKKALKSEICYYCIEEISHCILQIMMNCYNNWFCLTERFTYLENYSFMEIKHYVA